LKEASLAKLVYYAVVLLEDYQHAEDGPNKAEELKKGSGVAWGRLPAELRSRVESLPRMPKAPAAAATCHPRQPLKARGSRAKGCPCPRHSGHSASDRQSRQSEPSTHRSCARRRAAFSRGALQPCSTTPARKHVCMHACVYALMHACVHVCIHIVLVVVVEIE
jgi:hypothetical protein